MTYTRMLVILAVLVVLVSVIWTFRELSPDPLKMNGTIIESSDGPELRKATRMALGK